MMHVFFSKIKTNYCGHMHAMVNNLFYCALQNYRQTVKGDLYQLQLNCPWGLLVDFCISFYVKLCLQFHADVFTLFTAMLAMRLCMVQDI